MPGTTVAPEVRLLAAQLKTGDPKTIAKIAAALRRHGGNVRATSAALGLNHGTLYKWAVSVPGLKAVLDELGRGKGTPHEVTFKGETKTISEWADELGIKRSTLSMRIAAGMPLEKAFAKDELPRTRPATKKRAKKR